MPDLTASVLFDFKSMAKKQKQKRKNTWIYSGKAFHQMLKQICGICPIRTEEHQWGQTLTLGDGVWLTVGIQIHPKRCSGLGFVQTLLKWRVQCSPHNPTTRFSSCYFICLRTAQTHKVLFSSWQLTVNLVLTATNNYHMWVVSEWTNSLTHTQHMCHRSWQVLSFRSSKEWGEQLCVLICTSSSLY